ncbi:unnamed protein product, partial [Thlaspi arvense]
EALIRSKAAAMILSRGVSFTPVARASDEVLRRYLEFRGLSSSNCRSSSSCVRCSSLKSKSPQEIIEKEEGFSVLGSEIPWEEKNVWSTLAVYIFCLHIPLSFGGLSIVAHLLNQRLLDPQAQAVHNSELEKIMESGEVSRSGCVVLYCVVAPILEEIVYRRFLLSSLAARMEWRKALVISSGVFAAAHFSGEDSVQLFGIGCVLGGCYSWSGNLASSVVVHSLYNALTLLLAS